MRPRIGLALSGGGSRGAFTVGALRAVQQLLRPTTYPVISGTSTGALIGTMLATGQFRRLARIYSTVRTEQIVEPNHRLIFGLGGVEAVLFASAVLGGRSTFDATPLAETIANNVDFQRVKRSSSLVIYTTVDLVSGELVTYDNRRHSAATLAKALLASASMPVLTEPVRVRAGRRTRQLVDGGVREFLPLRGVFQSGVELDHIIAISTAPLRPKARASDFGEITEILTRTIDLLNSEVAENDHRGAVQFNAVLRMIENAEAAGVSRSALLRGVPRAFKKRLEGKRAVPVTFIGPRSHIEMDSLEFDPARMGKQMAKGLEVARARLERARLAT